MYQLYWPFQKITGIPLSILLIVTNCYFSPLTGHFSILSGFFLVENDKHLTLFLCFSFCTASLSEITEFLLATYLKQAGSWGYSS